MRRNLIRPMFWMLHVVVGATQLATAQEYSQDSRELASPDENIQLEFRLRDDGVATYRVSYREKPLVHESALGLTIAESGPWGAGVEIVRVDTHSHDETWQVVVGKSSEVRDHYRELSISLQEKAEPRRRVDIVFRAYNDGVAFRYRFPEQAAFSDFVLTAENSHFAFGKTAEAYVLPLDGFTTSYEKFYQKTPVMEIRPERLIGMPMLVKCGEGVWAAITEANLTDYAGMYLALAAGPSTTSSAEAVSARRPYVTLVSRLSPWPGDPKAAVKASTPHASPWRVLMIGATPGALIESNLVLNLNEPCRIEDTSWIKTGKINFPWWNGYVAKVPGIEGGLNTAYLKHTIDFCADAGIEYASLDGFEDKAWYGGPIRHSGPVDITTAIPEIDLPEVLRYAKEKGVRMRAWMDWVALKPQIDEALAEYEKLGIEGIMVDFMDRDDQQMVRFYHEVARKAAAHHLTVNFHGAYKPTGIRRTWPNVLTREAVLNLEYNKWARCPPEHNLMVPFTRMLAGPLDYHEGGFRHVKVDDFESIHIGPLVMGTRCHSLAMYVVYENPLPMVADYPAAYRDETGLKFLGQVPTNWDETRVLDAAVGQHITIARRKRSDWYVGSMTDNTARQRSLPLEFLGEGNFIAEIYADAQDADESPVHVDYQQLRVTAEDKMEINMAPSGGHVMRLTPSP
jgi:alpha-glucosidase